MTKIATIILLVCFGIFLFVSSRFIDGARDLGAGAGVWDIEYFLRYAGGFLAVAATLGLTLAAIRGTSPPRLVPYSAALLGGLLVMHPHWALAIALAVIVSTSAVCGVLPRKKEQES